MANSISSFFLRIRKVQKLLPFSKGGVRLRTEGLSTQAPSESSVCQQYVSKFAGQSPRPPKADTPLHLKRGAKTLFTLLLSVLFSANISAQTKMTAKEAKTLRTIVKEQAEKTQTITSDFTQYKHLDFLSNDIESNGKLAFKAPNLVKWEYGNPFAYSILFKNQTLYINDDGNKSNFDVGGNKIFKQLNELITSSIRGDLFDDTQFDISYFKENENSLVHFIPKDEQFSEFIKTFHITFNPAGKVTEVKMIEPSEDYTQIIFSNRIENQALSDADFAQ